MDRRSSALDQQQRMMAGMLVGLMLICTTGVQAASTATAKPAEKCSETDPSLGEIIFYSNAVVMGEILRHIPDTDQAATSFTAEMEVYCVYKTDHPVPRRINITNAGSRPGACFSTEFTVGSEYLAYLKEVSDGKGGMVFTPAYKHNSADYVDEIQVTCGINITYPQGLTKDNAQRSCEAEDYDYGDYPDDMDVGDVNDCVSFEPEVKSPAASGTEDGSSAEPNEDSKAEPDSDPEVDPTAKPNAEPKEEPDVKVGTGGNDNGDSGKEVPYQSGKTGKIENVGSDGGDSEPDPENGSVPLRMSLLLIALVYGTVLLIL